MVKPKFIRIHLIIILLMFFLSDSAIPEEKKDKAEEISIISVDDVINYQMLAEPQISPDGKKVLWVQFRADKEKDKHLREIWMGSTDGEIEPIQLTRGNSSSWSPRWSPDGKRIAFLSDREKKTQIYIISPFGGESEKLTDVKMGVNNFRWKNNEEIIFSAREDETFHEKNLKEKKDDAEVVEDMEAYYPVRLFSIELKDKKVTRLTKIRIELKISKFLLVENGQLLLMLILHFLESKQSIDPSIFFWTSLIEVLNRFLKKNTSRRHSISGQMMEKEYFLRRRRLIMRRKEEVEFLYCMSMTLFLIDIRKFLSTGLMG
ncbi:MAG: hypothetical protein AB1410_01275 [Acidobacteriota bacterium]